MALRSRGGEGPLDAGCEFGSQVVKGNARAELGNGVDDAALGLDRAGAIGDVESDFGAFGEGMDHVDMAATSAHVADANIQTSGAAGVSELSVSDIGVARDSAAFGIHGRLRGTVRGSLTQGN